MLAKGLGTLAVLALLVMGALLGAGILIMNPGVLAGLIIAGCFAALSLAVLARKGRLEGARIDSYSPEELASLLAPGEQTTKTFAIPSNITSITLAGSLRAEIVYGEELEGKMTGNARALLQFPVHTEGTQLTIVPKPNSPPVHAPTIVLCVPATMQSVTLSNACSGQITGRGGNLNVFLSSASQLTLKGEFQEMFAEIGSASQLKGFEANVQYITVRAHSAASAEIQVQTTLNHTVTTTSTLRYKETGKQEIHTIQG